MSKMVNIHEAKTHLSRLLEHVQAGEEVIIGKAGTPIAKIVPLERPATRPLGFVPGRVTDAFFEPLPPEELRQWE